MAISRSDIPRELKGNRKVAKDKKWIQKAIKKPGALRAKLGIAKGKTISKSQLDKAAKSRNPTTRKQANLAKTLKKMKRGRS